MSTNIASIGFVADSSQLKTAKSARDSLLPSARAAEQSSTGLTNSMRNVAATSTVVAASATRLTAAVQAEGNAIRQSSGAITSARAATNDLTASMNQMAGASGAVTAGTSRITAAIQAQEAATV